jgi:hypothetical protein
VSWVRVVVSLVWTGNFEGRAGLAARGISDIDRTAQEIRGLYSSSNMRICWPRGSRTKETISRWPFDRVTLAFDGLEVKRQYDIRPKQKPHYHAQWNVEVHSILANHVTRAGIAPRFAFMQATEAEACAYRRVRLEDASSTPFDFAQNNENRATAALTARDVYGDATALVSPSNATRTTSRAEEAGDAEVVLQKGTIGEILMSLIFFLGYRQNQSTTHAEPGNDKEALST